MNTYYKKYLKYKSKYLQLKGGFVPGPGMPETVDAFIASGKDYESDPDYFALDANPDGIESEWKPDLDLVASAEIYDPKPVIDSRLPPEQDVGLWGLARGVSRYRYEVPDNRYTTVNKRNKEKILRLNKLDDFDDFTERYGFVRDGILYIRWDKVKNDYYGLLLSENLYDERFEEAFYKGKYYPSWWENEYRFNNVMMFVEPEMEFFSGKPVTKPFKGKLFMERDFGEDEYIDIHEHSSPTKILLLSSYDDFDDFTNIYGYKKGNTIGIEWDTVLENYKGIMIDADTPVYPYRFARAYLKDQELDSWWKSSGLEKGYVYIFE